MPSPIRYNSPITSEFFVEAVGYQQAAIEEMERRAFSFQATHAMHPIKDKRARLQGRTTRTTLLLLARFQPSPPHSRFCGGPRTGRLLVEDFFAPGQTTDPTY